MRAGWVVSCCVGRRLLRFVRLPFGQKGLVTDTCFLETGSMKSRAEPLPARQRSSGRSAGRPVVRSSTRAPLSKLIRNMQGGY